MKKQKSNVLKRPLLEYTREAMKIYGVHANEDRALPDYRDGFKPVHRRTLWAMGNPLAVGLTKTARVVGDVLGKYHPHGDAPVQGAIMTLVNSTHPPIHGEGNWGSIVDNCASMRYTNVKLSKYGHTFLDKDYLAVTQLVPNYDRRDKEPVILPALYPNLLLNGTTGIGVGTVSRIPSYEFTSLMSVVVRMMKGEKLEIRDFVSSLEFKFPWGGRPVNTKTNRKAIAQFYKTGTGSIEFTSRLAVSKKNPRNVLFADFAPEINPVKVVEKLCALDIVQGVDNVTNKTGVKWLIRLKKSVPNKNLKDAYKRLTKLVTSTVNFRVNVTKRVKKDEFVDVSLFSTTVPELLKLWIDYRIQLEADSLDYRISKQKKQIAYTSLLLYAIDNLSVIMKALKQDDPDKYLMKALKLTEEQVKIILDLKVRQLSALDKKYLSKRRVEEKERLATLSGWRRKPKKRVISLFEKALEKKDD